MMRRFRFFCRLILFILCTSQTTYPITVMYSMKIRRVFAGIRHVLERDHKILWTFSLLPIAYFRKRHYESCAPLVNIHQRSLYLGTVFNLRCMPSDRGWIEVTTAFANERGKAKGISENPFLPVVCNASYTGFDDITIEGGYRMFPTDEMQFTFYGIAGFPTHTKARLKDALGTYVGSRFFGLGAGGEISYGFLESMKRSFTGILQARYVHFFNRQWTPILPCGSTIQPGDTIDILLALRWREKFGMYEIGYNPTLFLNQSVKIPLQGKVSTDDWARNGSYVSYSHFFGHLQHPLVLGGGIILNTSKFLKTRIYAGWLSMTVLF